jgi:PKHD-type hydroxylase
MLVHIPEVLTSAEVAHCRSVLEKTRWVDGRVTAGQQSAEAKFNLQVPESAPEARAIGDIVLRALARTPLFTSAVLPLKVFPPLFNRYDAGMKFDAHVDNAVRFVPDTSVRVRTDVSATLFLTAPEDYDGGELVVQDTYGTHSVKLPAGDMIVYPATSLHNVTPVTRGSRWASFFWIESMVRDEGQRSLLFDLDEAIQSVRQTIGEHPAAIQLTGVYHNLLRRWANT